jgi:predicted alpha/beta hydrolase family esterase
MIAQRTVFICINGIRAKPSDPRGWTDEFVTSLNIDTPDWVQAEKFEYYTSALFRWMKQRHHAQELARKVNAYLNAGYRVVLIGHSNGCDLIARLFDMDMRIDAAHLFAAAAYEKDFEAAIQNRLVRRVHLYGSPDDAALKTASITSRVLNWFGVGYGSMGLRGQKLAEKYPEIVKDHSLKGYGHSTWFIPGPYYAATMALLMANERSDRESTEAIAEGLDNNAPPMEPPTAKLP